MLEMMGWSAVESGANNAICQWFLEDKLKEGCSREEALNLMRGCVKAAAKAEGAKGKGKAGRPANASKSIVVGEKGKMMEDAISGAAPKEVGSKSAAAKSAAAKSAAAKSAAGNSAAAPLEKDEDMSTLMEMSSSSSAMEEEEEEVMAVVPKEKKPKEKKRKQKEASKEPKEPKAKKAKKMVAAEESDVDAEAERVREESDRANAHRAAKEESDRVREELDRAKARAKVLAKEESDRVREESVRANARAKEDADRVREESVRAVTEEKGRKLQEAKVRQAGLKAKVSKYIDIEHEGGSVYKRLLSGEVYKITSLTPLQAVHVGTWDDKKQEIVFLEVDEDSSEESESSYASSSEEDDEE